MPTLASELTIYTVGDVRGDCLRWTAGLALDSAGGDPATFDVRASGVDEVDAAGVQILLSLSNTLLRSGRRLRLVEPSAILAAACAALGTSALVDAAQDAEATR